jgi:hypothetical protein
MVSKEVKASARGARALIAQAYSHAHFKAKFRQKRWGPRWEDRDEGSKGKAPSKQARIEGKITITTYVCNKCFS